ncbi:MAG: EAL domain-containing protein [Pseudomonadales bacterium]|nr:EAL domain-containing protein [Pseudomonadales bacterium]
MRDKNPKACSGDQTDEVLDDMDDRRSDSFLRTSIKRFDDLVEQSKDYPQASRLFFETIAKLCQYPNIFIALSDTQKSENFNVVASYQSISDTSKTTLPITINARILQTIRNLNSSSSCSTLVPTLLEQLDFSMLGWKQPKDLELYPLRYQGHFLGILVCETRKRAGNRTDNLPRIQVLLRRFIEYTVKTSRPHLVANDIVPEFMQKEDLQIEAFINSPIAILLTNENFKINACNRPAERFFEIKGSDYEQRSLSSLLPEITDNQQLLMLQADKSKIFEYETPIITKSGQQKIGIANFRFLSWNNKNYWWVSIIDITKQRYYENLHHSHTQRLQTISDVTPTGLLQTNSDWEVVYANDMWCELTGSEKEELEGFNWLHFIAPEEIEGLITNLKLQAELGDIYSCKVRSATLFKTGREWFNLKAKPLPNNDGLVVCLEDITKQEEQHQRLLTMASIDSLTQLTNRAFFFDRLTQACHFAQRSQGFTLLSIDLDNFKWINDSLGHNVGDLALRIVSNHLLNCVRDTDTVARIGGDEFMILLPGCNDPHQVLRVSEKIISGSPEMSLFPTDLTLSVGIALVEDQEKMETNELLKQADFALYSAKNAGKNQACFYSTELSVALERELLISQLIRRGLKNKQFEVYYQLIWNSHLDCYAGAEALLRWHHPEEGILAPEKFISSLEGNGGMPEVSLYVIDESLRNLKRWINCGLLHETAHVAVNFSPKLFRIKDLPKRITTILEKHQMPGSALMVEITESTLFDDEVLAQTMISKLQQLGIRVALDDFGTGYSPLAYLTKFTIDCIKIDKSFVFDVDSKKNQAIIRAIASLANDLDLTLITEGIESNETFQYIESLKCRYYQGFLFHKPDNSEGTESTLLKRQSRRVSAKSNVNVLDSDQNTKH